MRPDKMARLCCAALWLLCTLVSLFHASLGAPVKVEKPSYPIELPANISQAVITKIENAFRNGYTVNNILKTLKGVGGDVNLRELSKAVVTHVLATADKEQRTTTLSGDEQLFTPPEVGEVQPPTVGAGASGVDSSQDTEVTSESRSTRFQRQTTPLTTSLPGGGVTLPIVPSSDAGLEVSGATAATRRWLDAGKKVDSVTSTPMPPKEDENNKVVDVPIVPNAPVVPADGKQIPSGRDMEDNTTTGVTEDFKGDSTSVVEVSHESSSSGAEATETTFDSFVGAAAAIEPASSSKDSKNEDPEDSKTPQLSGEEISLAAAQTPEASKDADLGETKTNNYTDAEEIPYGQDEVDPFTREPFDPRVEKTAVTTATTESTEEQDEDKQPVATATTAPILPTPASSETEEETPTEKPEENATTPKQPKVVAYNYSTEDSETETSTIVSGASEDDEDNARQVNKTDDTAKSSPSPALPTFSTVDEDRTMSTVASVTTEPESSVSEADNDNATTVSATIGSSMSEQDIDSNTIPTPATKSGSSLTSDVKASPTPTTSSISKMRPPSLTSASSGTMTDPQTIMDNIARFQDPLRLLLINRLGGEFARLTQVFRKPNLTDPLPDISAVVSEALSSVHVQHLIAPTKRNAVEERHALHLSVNGVRVNVNVTRQPDFVQHGTTTVNHITVDRRRMYVRLHLHFHNVSVPLNFSLSADLFPPFFSVRRASGEAHVEIEEILVPLRIPLKLYYQKNAEDEAATAGVLMPEDFVTHGASMVNVSTHFADCGDRDFMEEVLRFEEHLKNRLELWLSRDPLTSLTNTLRSHLLVASRRPATMRLARSVDDGSSVADITTPKSVVTGVVIPDGSGDALLDDNATEDEDDDMEMFGFGD